MSTAPNRPRAIVRRLDSVLAGWRGYMLPLSVADPEQADCPLVWVNDAFCALTGYSRDEVLLRNCRFLQAGIAQDTGAFRAGVRQRRDCHGELINVAKNGRRFRNFVSVCRANLDGVPILVAAQGEISPDDDAGSPTLGWGDAQARRSITRSLEQAHCSIILSHAVILQQQICGRQVVYC